MSALSGLWRFGAAPEPLPSCRRMLVAQAAYGPHGGHAAAAGDVALGRDLFRTLPQDVDDIQPLSGRGGRLLMVADLRLDNRDELLDRLGERGAEAARLPDSAILMRVYARWGEAVLDMVVGDYAFAVWDADARHLLLARDPLGQRPLCYHMAKGFFAFASMPKGLHALAEIPRRPDRTRLAEFVGTVPHHGPSTFYEGVSRVEPGHVVTVSPGEVRSRRYWNPERRELHLARPDDYRDAFRDDLDRAVRSRLRGVDGVVAAHLSSGWDSSAVAATAARLLAPEGGRVLAFTSVPRRGNDSEAPMRRIADEGPIAAEVAAMYDNMEHHRIEGSARSPVGDLDRIVDLFDRPLINLCNEVWMGDIRAAAAAGGARILLTGEIGNWTISAAPVSLLADLIREGRWGAWWREARAKVRQGGARYRGVAASSFGPWLPPALWRLVTPLSSAPPASDYSAINPALKSEIFARRAAHGSYLARPAADSFAEVVPALNQYDYGHFRKAALAGWGIDERDPTADRRVIEFCLSLPIDMLLKDGVRRPLARAALADRLPPAVLQEKSKGYQAADWHEGLTRNLPAVVVLLETVARDERVASLVDIEALRQWIADWPEDGWEKLPVMARYRSALLQALGAGHFVTKMPE